jgi:hypothetical protein
MNEITLIINRPFNYVAGRYKKINDHNIKEKIFRKFLISFVFNFELFRSIWPLIMRLIENNFNYVKTFTFQKI